jgi:hypothetical protein
VDPMSNYLALAILVVVVGIAVFVLTRGKG